MFVWISSEPQDILLPNLVWLCSVISQNVMQKNWFTVFSVKVTVRAYIIKIWLFLLYLLKCWSVCNQTWFDSTASWASFVLWKNGITAVKVKMLVNVCPGDIFWTTEYFVAKPGMVMQHHKQQCHAEKLVHCVQCRGHSEGLYNQSMIISVVSFKLLVGLQPNLVC